MTEPGSSEPSFSGARRPWVPRLVAAIGATCGTEPSVHLDTPLAAVRSNLLCPRAHTTESSLAGLAALGTRSTGVVVPIAFGRSLPHTRLACSQDSSLTSVDDIAGCRVAVPELLQTTVIWLRGILVDDYGIDDADVEWVLYRPGPQTVTATVGWQPPAGVRWSSAHGSALELLDRDQVDVALVPPDVSIVPASHRWLSVGSGHDNFGSAHGFVPASHTYRISSHAQRQWPGLGEAIIDALATASRCGEGSDDLVLPPDSGVVFDTLWSFAWRQSIAAHPEPPSPIKGPTPETTRNAALPR